MDQPSVMQAGRLVAAALAAAALAVGCIGLWAIGSALVVAWGTAWATAALVSVLLLSGVAGLVVRGWARRVRADTP